MEFWVAILTLWAVYRWVRSIIRRQKDDERFERVVDGLNRLESRSKILTKLESRVDELEKQLACSTPAQQTKAPAPPATETKPVGPAAPVTLPPPPEIPMPSAPLPLAAEPTPPLAPQPVIPPPSAPKPIATTPTPSTPHPIPSVRPAPSLFSTPPQPPPVSAREFTSRLEETLGKNWLNKLGIIALVIGVSLFLAYKFPSLSNPGKVGLGYLVSFAILGTGIYLERNDRYRVFARALIGGGWALTFFVTYAMHFVQYTRVIETQWIDLVLLFVVAGVMVVHTLRYDSQVVTGLAFLLAFTTVAISQNTIYSLSAGSILALGLVAIVHRREWFALEVFGILASYANHFVWLASVIVPMGGRHRMFPEFIPSTLLLCLYWATYRWSYIARNVQDATQERISALAAILNTSLLLVLFKYQSVRPELAFYALLVLGAAEFSLGQLPATRRRRPAFIILSIIGVVLLVAAIPFKYSGMDTAIIWLAEAQIFMFAGVFTREILFRRVGMLVALLTSGDMLLKQVFPTLYNHVLHVPGPVLDLFTSSPVASDFQLALSFFVAASLFYGNSLAIPRRWKDLISSDNETILFRALSYLAAVMLFASIWFAFSDSWTAVVWVAAAFLLLVLARVSSAGDLTYQAHLFSLAAVFRAFVVNYFDSSLFLRTSISLRLVTLSLIIALLYICARWLGPAESEDAVNSSELYTTAAAALTVALIYRECDSLWIAVGWGVFATLLAVLGIYATRRDLSLHAHAIVLAGFARTLLVNMDATHEWHHLTIRFLTFTLMAVLLYLCAYFSGPRDSEFARFFSAFHTWAGSILVAVLAFEEVSSPWIAVAWATFAFLLLIVGHRLKRLQLHFQAYFLSVAALVQIATVNLDSVGPWSVYSRISLRLITVAIAAALFYASARWAAKGEYAQAPLAGAAYTWAASSLVVLLLYFELAPSAVALGWGLLGLLLFEIGVRWKSVSWHLQSYLVFALSFGRILYFNLDSTPQELLLATLPIAAIFYLVYIHLTHLASRLDADRFPLNERIYAANVLSYLGSATLTLFANSYFHSGWILLAWAALAFLFIAVSWGSRQNVFLHHSMLLAAAVFVRCLYYQFVAQSLPHNSWYDGRAFYITITAAILFSAQAFAFPLRARFAAGSGAPSADINVNLSNLFRRPEQVYFFLPMILLTFLIFNEVSAGRVTIGWGMEAVAAFLFALIVGERSFRLAGLGLLLVCVGKIVVLDVWRQERSDRFITFIILGIALLLVSYLYTRYSDAIRRYL
ncbi:MAG TPA: DUF2339 domain-containing protein [Candidatus Angelobacter sp.]|nr:DUF2339 domain-containing protein [Candidatus Angelobacter sp.]